MRVLLGLIAAVMLATGPLAVGAAPPNVLLIVTDDQGYGDLGCYGNPVLKTPALDKLHGQSARFANFHVDPTCSPTRSALMTGRFFDAHLSKPSSPSLVPLRVIGSISGFGYFNCSRSYRMLP